MLCIFFDRQTHLGYFHPASINHLPQPTTPLKTLTRSHPLLEQINFNILSNTILHGINRSHINQNRNEKQIPTMNGRGGYESPYYNAGAGGGGGGGGFVSGGGNMSQGSQGSPGGGKVRQPLFFSSLLFSSLVPFVLSSCFFFSFHSGLFLLLSSPLYLVLIFYHSPYYFTVSYPGFIRCQHVLSFFPIPSSPRRPISLPSFLYIALYICLFFFSSFFFFFLNNPPTWAHHPSFRDTIPFQDGKRIWRSKR